MPYVKNLIFSIINLQIIDKSVLLHVDIACNYGIIFEDNCLYFINTGGERMALTNVAMWTNKG